MESGQGNEIKQIHRHSCIMDTNKQEKSDKDTKGSMSLEKSISSLSFFMGEASKKVIVEVGSS